LSLSDVLYDRISAGAPHAEEAEVRTLLAREYGLQVRSIARLGGEIDDNFRVDCADARSYVIRIAGDLADPGQLQWQSDVLRHLENTCPDLPVPRLVTTLDGESMTRLKRGSRENYVRVVTFLPGIVVAELQHKALGLLHDFGNVAGRLSAALRSMRDPDVAISHHWNLARAEESLASCLPFVTDPERRALIDRMMTGYRRHADSFAMLPQGIVHHDLNEFNVLASPDDHGFHRVSGIVDFGDAVLTTRASELAVAIAYGMLRTGDPLRAATEVVRGFHAASSLTEAEVSVLFPLAAARLCVYVATWARRTAAADLRHDAARAQAWTLLARLDRIPAAVPEAAFRAACGWDPLPLDRPEAGSLVSPDVRTAVIASVGGPLTRHLAPAEDAGVRATTVPAQPETLEVGVRFATEIGTPVPALLDSTVERVDHAARRLVLRHREQSAEFWSHWTGLRAEVAAGDEVVAGQLVGVTAGATPGAESGLRLQLVSAPELSVTELPVRVQPWLRSVWAALCPDPAVLIGDPASSSAPTAADVVARRERYVGRAQRFYYRQPMCVVSSKGAWLRDADGLDYLDAINNVTHVGHSDPTVSDAITRQVGRLNTNSRFVYPELADYAERLARYLPDQLSVVYFVCTGSEANDLALRMARQVTGREHVMVIDGAYHGNTSAVIDISPDRFDGPGGQGRPPTTHVVAQPDRYRGPYGYDDPGAGPRYAADVERVVGELAADGAAPAAFFTEALIGSGGEITLPDGYLDAAYRAVRRAGGLCVSDEIQIGFGRMGDRFWGFELQGVTPDIVTVGKPMANGMPLAAVITTPAIAAEFDQGMKYFNTFAGNPVCCAAGLAVLEVIERDGLQQHAADVGRYFLDQLAQLRGRHELIGDVRGQGLYLGIELVRDRQTKEPAAVAAAYISERMREEGVVVYPNGRFSNVLKIKPPMIFTRGHVDLFTQALDQVLSEEW
jgi:4-aminobutyrate aminotransferase-like enzyme/Ser/Thr protein kinase RdoA (MazF antagonist)